MSNPDIGYYIAELRHMACNAGMDVDDKAHLEAAANEFERYLPFKSRAEVEEYLKGKDWKVEVGEDDGCSCCGNGKNKDTKAVRGDKTIYIFACDLCMYGDAFKISVSILTPALLDAILEAK